jgi:hypothetical protein
MLHCCRNSDKRLTWPTASISGTFNLPIYGGAGRLIREGYPLTGSARTQQAKSDVSWSEYSRHRP